VRRKAAAARFSRIFAPVLAATTAETGKGWEKR
jgi:hypothetical protein